MQLHRLFAGLIFLLPASCATATTARLDEQVAFFNDDLRWGRYPSAEQMVASQHRDRFQRSIARWRSGVQIVDVEIEGTRVQGSTALVRTRYTWTDARGISTRETVIEARWRAQLTEWVCDDWQVIGGDPRLLASR